MRSTDIDNWFSTGFEPVEKTSKAKQTLNEATYKELLVMLDDNFLDQKNRTAALRAVFFRKFTGNTMKFDVTAYNKAGKFYENLVQFPQWDQVVQDPSFNAVEAARVLLWGGDVKLFCSCPSFLFWGYQYILTVLDSSIYDEDRKPVVRNAQERGLCCKHMRKCLQVMPAHIGDIAAQVKRVRAALGQGLIKPEQIKDFEYTVPVAAPIADPEKIEPTEK
jgi:hypothetical protein